MAGKYPFIQVEPGRTIKGVNPTLLAGLNRIGQMYGQPITIYSGYRSSAYSAQVGGFAGDPHTRGEAVDATIGGQQIGQVVPVAVFQRVGLESGNTPGFYNGKPDPGHVQIPGSGVNKGLVSPALGGSQPTVAQPSGFVQVAAQAARANGIDPSLFVAQIHQESGFNPAAVSGAGAQGIAQIVPGYHPDAPPASDPVGQIQWAAKYMAGLVKKYGSYEPALSVYNSGKPTTYLDPGFAKGQTYNYVRSIASYAKANPIAGASALTSPTSPSLPVSAPPAPPKALTVAPKAPPVQPDQSAAMLAALSTRVQPYMPPPATPAPALTPVTPTPWTPAPLPTVNLTTSAPLTPPTPAIGANPSFAARLQALVGHQ